MVSIPYQVGGSLKQNHPLYVVRQADHDLYHALEQGEFCYALHARQMGKSSLLVRTKYQLEQAGVRCAVVDMTGIGSELVTPEQWYKGIAYTLWMGFELMETFSLKTWWQQQEDLSHVQRLGLLLDTLLQTFPQQKLVIFIDEIDSVLSLGFPVDDFFALIRFCYNQRAVDPAYERITFALFGVATPADLIRDKNRTLFNIGRAIELQGFQLHEAEPLAAGLKGQVSNPHALLQEILRWTDGQPFLTQKLCYLIAQAVGTTPQRFLTIPPGTEGFWVDNLVYTHVIQDWESQDEPEHLSTIRDRLLRDPQHAGQRLGLYQQVLHLTSAESGQKKQVQSDSQEQVDLLLSGLVVKRQGRLQVSNLIYRAVFTPEWVERQLAALRPYSQSLTAWVASGQQDQSRLLRGQALADAQAWTEGKHLSLLDYQFLMASQAVEQQSMQQALEAERLRQVESRLQVERSNARRQRSMLILVTLALALSLGLGLVTFDRYRQAAINEIRAIAKASELFYASSRGLDALVSALKADARLRSLGRVDAETQAQVDKVLRQAVYNAAEVNRFTGHQGAVGAVAFSPDEQLLASGSEDRTVKLWQRDGTLLKTLYGHSDRVWTLAFDRTGERLASGSEDRTVILWGRDGSKRQRLIGHNGGVTAVTFSPDGQLLASASTDRTVKLWSRDGNLLTTLVGHTHTVRTVAFSDDGLIATGSDDGTLKLWDRSGTLMASIPAHPDRIRAVAFSPSGGILASAGDDATIRLWTREGTLLHTLQGHRAAIHSLAIGPYGQLIASASRDHTIKLWNRDGLLLATLQGHDKPVRSVAFSRDGRMLASASDDETLRLWKTNNIFLTPVIGHEAGVTAVAFHPKNRTLITASEDKTIRFWNRRGALLRTLSGHEAGVLDLSVSADGRMMASVGADGVMKLWTAGGQLLQSIPAHRAAIGSVVFGPNTQVIATGSDDRMVKLWRRDGSLLRELSGHVGNIRDVAFSQQLPLLASVSSDGAIRLWRNQVMLSQAGESGWRTNDALLSSFGDYSAEILAAAFSPNQPLLATAWDKTIKLWHTDGSLLKTLRGHQGKVRDVVFSPDGRLLASASEDSTVKLWSANGVELTTLDNHTGAVWALAFSPDGQTLASVSDDRTGLLWDLQLVLDTAALRKYGCAWVQDYVHTSAEIPTRDRHLCEAAAWR